MWPKPVLKFALVVRLVFCATDKENLTSDVTTLTTTTSKQTTKILATTTSSSTSTSSSTAASSTTNRTVSATNATDEILTTSAANDRADGGSKIAATEMKKLCNGQRSAFSDDIWYLYCDIRNSWSSAKRFCKNNGMYLASFKDRDDLMETLNKIGINKTPDASLGPAVNIERKQHDSRSSRSDSSFWVGANDIEIEGEFIWTDTFSVVSSDLWAQGYPIKKAVTQDCGYVDAMQRMLKNRRCSGTLNVLCYISISKPLWYNNDMMLCHCADGQCNTEGECLSGGCARGWFGPKCQFKNLDFDIDEQGRLLQDYDNSTCVLFKRNYLLITFTQRSHFTWLRLIMKDIGQLQGFTLYLDGVKDTSAIYIMHDQRTMDVRTSIYTSECRVVEMFWTEAKTMCTLYVYGGRNMGLKQKANFNFTASTPASLAVDGYSWNSDQCFKGWRMWQLHFPEVIALYNVDIYRKIESTNRSFPPHFAVRATNEDDDMECISDDFRAHLGPYVRLIPEEELFIKSLILYRNPIYPGGVMSVCEVVVYGECAPPKYGLDCENVCSITCVRQKCHYSGQCLDCPSGKTGANCSEDEVYTKPKKTNKNVSDVGTHLIKLIFVIVHGGVAMVMVTALLGYIMSERVRKRSTLIHQTNQSSPVLNEEFTTSPSPSPVRENISPIAGENDTPNAALMTMQTITSALTFMTHPTETGTTTSYLESDVDATSITATNIPT
ncbi:uncharacterized protein LOC106074425 isoform X1 [Biomphalaria glabrata]|uniref:Uncharacterized protein LOC106074425 isoform X1 n=1 Tax=Biomphalaria glabrata TaxID=6526 RepID=A0A9W2ZFV7_BIOGL|nr:uncharacterized protein LOC106074425 isoform X1 [Biomphalaria glabrata]